MKFEIDIEEVIKQALVYMEDEGDLRWSVGMALQDLYWEKGWDKVQERMIEKFHARVKANTFS